MARRKRKNQLTVSLFPFLSVLACVIGTLTLMITSMALGQLDNETVARAEQYEEVETDLTRERSLIKQLTGRIDQITGSLDDTTRQLADARLKLEELKQQQKTLAAELTQSEDRPRVSPIDPDKHDQRMTEIKAEIVAARQEIETLLAELERREVPTSKADVVIQPSGSGTNLEPTFVECTAAGIMLLGSAPPKRVRKADLATDASFAALLEQTAGRDNATVIFLIRQDGIPTYVAARKVAVAKGSRNGKLPVIGDGVIDLSEF